MHSSRKSCLLRPAVVPWATAVLHLLEHTLILSPLMLVEPDGRLDGEEDSGAAAACGPSCIMSPEPCSVLGVPWLEACANAQGEASTRLSAAAANSIVFMETSPYVGIVNGVAARLFPSRAAERNRSRHVSSRPTAKDEACANS